jgi:heme A synthase
VTTPEILHRWVSVVVGLIVAGVWLVAWRTQRANRWILGLATIAAVLFPIQALIGGLQVLTQLAGWTQTLHVALGAIIWGPWSASARSATQPGRPCAGLSAGEW